MVTLIPCAHYLEQRSAMAAETQSSESLEDETGPLPQERSEIPPSPSSSEESTHPYRLNWVTTLSPVRRCCINLGNTEMCVNRAMANLEALKEIVTKPPEESTVSPLPTQTARPTSVTVKISAVDSTSDLSVEGLQTGTIVNRLGRVSMIKKVNKTNGGGGKLLADCNYFLIGKSCEC